MKRATNLAVAVWLVASVLCSSSQAEVRFDLEESWGAFGIGKAAFDRPVDVAVDKDDNKYVLDFGNNRIQVLDRRGRFVREWGERGFSPKQFDGPVALTLHSSGRLFVVDAGNHRIQVFNTDGTLATTGVDGKTLVSNPIGRLGSRDGEFNKPSDVTIDKRGYLWVADTGNNRVQVFDTTGKFQMELGKFARRTRGKNLQSPVSVAFTPEGFGAVYVIDAKGCRVDKYDLDVDATLLGSWEIHKKGEELSCGSPRIQVEPRKYTVYISDTENDRVLIHTKDGDFLGDLKEGTSPFKRPGGLAFIDDFGEDFVVTDTGNNRVDKFHRGR